MANTKPKWVERPDHAFIGNHVYRVEWLTNEEWEAARHPNDAAACTEAERNLIAIRLKADGYESFYQELLIHELTHAAWDATMLTHAPLDSIEDKEEFIIGTQSPALLGILKNNPHIIQYLISDGTVLR